MFLTIRIDPASADLLARIVSVIEIEQAEPAQQAAIDALTARLAASRNNLAAAEAAAAPAPKS